MSRFDGKVVLITGASSGIGEGTAVHFAGLGAKLVLSGRSAENLERVAGRCVEAGCSKDEVITVQGDITISDDRDKLIKACIDKFQSLNVLINNAGMIHYTSIGEATPQQYDELFDTNVKGHVFLTQLALPHLIKSKGNIVNTSSICGPKSMPTVGVYCMTKAAFDSFTQCLALEMAPHKVRVNAVNPGTIVSNIARRAHCKYQDDDVYEKFLGLQKQIHPLGRVGQPDDCAEAIAFLASDAASFTTGQLLYVDGGRNCVCPGVFTSVTK